MSIHYQNRRNLNPKLKSYLTLLIFLIVGMLAMGMAQLFKAPDWLHPAFIVLTLLVIINIVTAHVLNLITEIKTFWSFKKIYFFPIGILAGALVAVSPTIIGVIIGEIQFSELKFDTTFTINSILVTFAIVTWEELWFRGIFLNYCHRSLSAIHISITIGLLFMLVHLLNPKINLLRTGPTLFFAGAFLTIVYFYFKTIWLPIGLHFGNNYLTLESALNKHWLFGNEGYFTALILAILFLLCTKLILASGDPTNRMLSKQD